MLSKVLCDLEKQLLTPEVRRSPADIDRLLADEFVEFGSSGRVYTKQQCADGMSPIQASLSDFKAELLAPGIALTTYRLVKHDETHSKMTHSLRSSIWKLKDSRWQMIFHQGTPAEAV